MIIDNYLTDKAKHKKFLKINEDGIKQYKKDSYIQCYKKREKVIYENVAETNIKETINCVYYVKQNRVKTGDLIDDCEVYQIQNYKKIGVDCCYVK